MLVLARRQGQRIVITLPDETAIEVTVVRVRDQEVRLGFDAPRDVAIHRAEIHDRIHHLAPDEPPGAERQGVA